MHNDNVHVSVAHTVFYNVGNGLMYVVRYPKSPVYGDICDLLTIMQTCQFYGRDLQFGVSLTPTACFLLAVYQSENY